MTSDGSEKLFNDVWREPSDNCERMAYYFATALVTLAGIGSTGWGAWTLFTSPHSSERIVGLVGTVLGSGLTALTAAFFVKESKHWDLRHLTAERFVAGGFLLGFALLLLAFQIASHSGSIGGHVQTYNARDLEGGFVIAAWLGGAGLLVLTVFLVLGLMFAYSPSLRLRRRIADVRIERRYAIDDKLGEVEEHPCPRTDGMTPVVTLRLRDGRTQTIVCSEAVYEWLKTGAKGTAVVRGKRLERFHLT